MPMISMGNEMVHNLSEHELGRLVTHLNLHLKLLDKHYSQYNPTSLVCDLMEDVDILRSRIRAILYPEVEETMTTPSFECPSDKFGILIGECVKMSEVLNRSAVRRLAFIPIGNEWKVDLVLASGESWQGKKSLSKGESLKSLHTMLAGLVQKEIDKLKATLGEAVEE